MFKSDFKGTGLFQVGADLLPKGVFVVVRTTVVFMFVYRGNNHRSHGKLRFLQTDQNFIVYKRQNFAFACLLLNGRADNNVRHLQNVSRKSHVFISYDV